MYVYIIYNTSAIVTLCCWQKVTMMGRHTPGAGFLSSITKRVLSAIGIIAVYMVLFLKLKSFSGYAKEKKHVDIDMRKIY